ncbi:hypothetical protein MMC25_004174 [Agyrium rufum]|nr:hypothetical protein [Agyrium rufum]
MLLLGLTGSIATGKSTVSKILFAPPYSLPIIDADLLARQVVEPGMPGYRAIVAHFGSTTPDLLQPASSTVPEDGVNGKGRPLNRAALGRRVFGNDEGRMKDRKVLNGIVHPAVRWAMAKALLKYYLQGSWAVVLDVPLLLESGLDVFVGSVLVVAVKDPEVQMRRLRERDAHLSAEEAADRVKSQWDVRDKARRVEGRGKGRGLVVWNDGDRGDLERELEKIMKDVRRGSPRWWAWLLLGFPPLALVLAAWEMWVGRSAKRRWEDEERREKAKL